MLSAQPPFFFHPALALGVQGAVSTIALGLRTSSSPWWGSVLTVPVQVGCVGVIISKARSYVRPAWAAWVASFSVSTLLRCLGQCFLSSPSPGDTATLEKPQQQQQLLKSNDEQRTQTTSIMKRLLTNLNNLMDFRHLNSADEAKNTPTFSSKDPTYAPRRGRFLVNTVVKAIFSYLVIDLLTGSPLPHNALVNFAPERMHFFTRLGSVTSDELIMRYVLPVSVFVVGAALLELSHDVLAFAAVAFGWYEPRDWRPQFGSPISAFTLRRFWGEVWHQNLRITFNTWSNYIAHNVLGLPRSSTQTLTRLCTRYVKLILIFAISGLVHLAAEVASGVPATKARPWVFFLYQAVGIMAEDAVEVSYASSQEQKEPDAGSTRRWVRLVGYAWVWSFMAWTVPWWIFPPTYEYALKGEAPRSLVPFSVVRWQFT